MTTVLANAASFLLSAAGIRAIGGSEPRPVRVGAARLRVRDLPDGWRYILAHPALRPLFFNTISVNALIMATAPLLAVLMLGRLHFAPWQYGLAFAGPCVGGLIGSRLARRLVARFGRHKVMLTAGTLRACFSVGLAFIGPGAAGLVLVMAIELGLITSAGVFNPVYATYRLDQTPADRVARTLSAWSVSSNATIAALTAVWGVLASLTSLRAALAIAGLLLLATPLLLPRRDHAARAGGNWPAPPLVPPRDDRFRRVTWVLVRENRRLLGRLWRRGKRYPDGVAEHRGRPDQGPDVGILVTIRALLPNLAPVERRVAQIVLDDPAGVAWRSISELARSCGTSATSVVRFCRAVGLRGYPELRLALAGAVAHDDAAAVAAASSDIDPDDDAATITKKIAFADARAVTETASHLNIATLTQVVDALAKASRIDIYGVGASGYVALDLQQKLQRIGRPPSPGPIRTWPSRRLHCVSTATWRSACPTPGPPSTPSTRCARHAVTVPSLRR